jgi:hypothetical protein
MRNRCGNHRTEQQNTNIISVKQLLQTDKTVHVMLVSVKFAVQDLQISNPPTDGFGGLVVSMLASGSRWIFYDVKKSSTCLPSEGK